MADKLWILYSGEELSSSARLSSARSARAGERTQVGRHNSRASLDLRAALGPPKQVSWTRKRWDLAGVTRLRGCVWPRKRVTPARPIHFPGPSAELHRCSPGTIDRRSSRGGQANARAS